MDFKGILCSLVLVVASISANAQTGSISGVITDGRDSTNKPIFGAQVFINGTTHGAFTGMDGSYSLTNVEPGKYDVTVSYVLIGEQKIEGVKVEANQNTVADLPMGESVAKEAGIKIILSRNEASATTATNEVKNETKVVEVLAAEDIKKRGDNKVSDAAKRISGVSIVDGKYAYVRGLSDRYTKTLLNGSEIPGLDPNRNAVQLDLFPTSFVQSMKVIKTYSPDLPADFTGGLIDIRTNDMIDSFTVKLSLGSSYNPQVTFNENYLLYNRSSTDWLGYDDGQRQFPNEVMEGLENGEIREGYFFFPETYDKTIKSFNKEFDPTVKSNFLNHNMGLVVGDRKRLLRKDSIDVGRNFGYFAGVNYRREYEYYENGRTGDYELGGTVDQISTFNPKKEFTVRQGTDNVLIGAVANFTYRFNSKNKIGFTYLHNHSGTSEASFAEGTRSDNTNLTVRVRQLSYLQRSINSGQLYGEHDIDSALFKAPLKIEWFNAYTLSRQEQPDLRFFTDDYFTNPQGERVYQFSNQIYNAPGRYNRLMNEQNNDFKVHFTLPVALSDTTQLKLKTGFSTVYKNREFRESRVDITTNPRINYNGDIDDFLKDENLGIITIDGEENRGVGLINQTFARNNYDGKMTVLGTYLMGELPLHRKLDLIAGARYERTDILVTSQEPLIAPGELKNNDILPSVTLIYSFLKDRFKYNEDSSDFKKQDLKLRASYNKTLARPSFREIAPFATIDYLLDWTLIGNPELERTSVDNYDLRLEWYPNSGQVMSVAAFYKRFNDPIALIVNPMASNIELQWKNTEEAKLYGIELEFKRDFSFIKENLTMFDLGFNVAFTKSVDLINQDELDQIRQQDPYHADTRPFFGQSPYILNVFLQYTNDSSNVSANLSYNIFGDRIAIIVPGGLPNIYEKSRGELNFNLSKKFGERLSLTLRLKNILNPDYKFTFEFAGNDPAYDKFEDTEYIFQSYKKGRQFGLSASYIF